MKLHVPFFSDMFNYGEGCSFFLRNGARRLSPGGASWGKIQGCSRAAEAVFLWILELTLWENHGKTMGKPWENGKIIGKP